jgi:hypothetical protein
LLEGIYFDDIWVVSQNFAYPKLFLGAVYLISVLVGFEDLNTYDFLLAVSNTFGQVDFSMHSISDLFNCLDI